LETNLSYKYRLKAKIQRENKIYSVPSKLFEAKRSEYSLVCKDLKANIRLKVRFCQFSLQRNEYSETNIRQYEKLLIQIFASELCMWICENILKRINGL
jgi:hypothetical protein